MTLWHKKLYPQSHLALKKLSLRTPKETERSYSDTSKRGELTTTRHALLILVFGSLYFYKES